MIDRRLLLALILGSLDGCSPSPSNSPSIVQPADRDIKARLPSNKADGQSPESPKADPLASDADFADIDPEKLRSECVALINDGGPEDWKTASDLVKTYSCFIYSSEKSKGLTSSEHVEMAKRYRAGVDEFYRQLADNDKVIEVLAIMLTIDGPVWIEELKKRRQ